MSVSNIISTPEWTLQNQQYLAQAAKTAAEIRGLYREIIDRIAEGELSPRALDEALPAFLQANGAALTNDLAEISVRYLARHRPSVSSPSCSKGAARFDVGDGRILVTIEA